MTCPRCFSRNFTPEEIEEDLAVSLVSETGSATDTSNPWIRQYVCNDPTCNDKPIDEGGRRTQFRVVRDSYIRFPFDQIFIGRGLNEFYKKLYL